MGILGVTKLYSVGQPLVMQRGNGGLQDTVYILLPPCCKKFCTNFCICCTPTLLLKMNAKDPAYRWCRLLVLFFWFSPIKFDVGFEKVGIIAEVHIHITPRIEKVLIKS